MPDFPGRELCIDSDRALDLPTLPRKIMVVGGGYIGIEMACMFRGFGTETHYGFRGAHPLREFDAECARFVTQQVEDVGGLHLVRHSTPRRVTRQPDGRLTYAYTSQDGTEGEVTDCDQVLMATGRTPNTQGLGLEAAGVQVNPRTGAILVDDHCRTSVANIYAVGDVIDRIQLTPVALMEGMAVAKTLFGGGEDGGGGKPTKPDYRAVASAVFSQPPLASVGLSEEEAVKQCGDGDVDVYVSDFRPLKNTLSGSQGRCLMKLVVHAGTNVVVGCHMVGPDAAEIMQGMAVAVKLGATKEQLDAVVGIHPSSAEEFVTMRSVTRRIRGGKVVKA